MHQFTNPDSIMAYLSTHFQMTSYQANCFLGLQIDRNRERRELLLSQPQYIAGILRRFKMSTCFPTKTPADNQSHLTTSMSPTTPEGISSMAGVPYKEAIGSLIYLMMCTRPDIAYAVGQAARFSQNPDKPTGQLSSEFFRIFQAFSIMENFFPAKDARTLSILPTQTMLDVSILVNQPLVFYFFI